MPATCLFLILMSSSYVKIDTCVHGRYVSLLLGGGCPRRNCSSGVFYALRGGMPNLAHVFALGAILQTFYDIIALHYSLD
jgi:hypothetical protein